ncbi:MAG: hypothetical protein EXS31_18380 [Pedosphaera sp.]|nr:hypothetical protein [Pedosphaera sp.]
MNRPPERGQPCPREPAPNNSRTWLSALLSNCGSWSRCAISKSWKLHTKFSFRVFRAFRGLNSRFRRRLRGLVDELTQLLQPLDSRWLTFGLKRPGAPDSPDAVENTRATALGGGKLRVQCNPAPRADYYTERGHKLRFWHRDT